jgi:hypothetical protein
MLLSRKREENKEERLVEGEVVYDPLEDKEESELIPELQTRESYEFFLPDIVVERKKKVEKFEIYPVERSEESENQTNEKEEDF